MKAFISIANFFRSKAGFLAGLILFSSLATIAQQPAPAKKRPTLGLALQGGGALGLAHVGVITWMEEHHIPVDYVAGTSMGGLVGGVYATGHNAAELRQVVNSINWDQVMAGQTPFDDLSFPPQGGRPRLSQQPGVWLAQRIAIPMRDSTPANRSC